MIRLKLLTIVTLFCAGSAFSQTGYYGSKHSFEFKVDVASSFKRRDKIAENSLTGATQLNRPLRIVHTNYGFNYSFVPTRRLELSLGIEYSAFRESTINGRYTGGTTYDLITAPRASIINGKFEFKFYRKGSLSPIGKYLGFSLQFGTASISSGQQFVYGDLGSESGSFFVRRHSINFSDTATTDITANRIFNLTLQGKVGRVWPLTQNISLVTGMSFPVGSAFLVPGQLFPVLTPFLLLDGLGTYTVTETGGDWDEYLMQSVRRVNSLAMEVSVRFHL